MAGTAGKIVTWEEGAACCNAEWEAAYARFETPVEETAKFAQRYRRLGFADLPRDLHVVELFCGRGNGLKALEHLGFARLEGVDLSPELLSQYDGPATLYVGDCRRLRFADQSKDMVVVHGGLHHLPSLPADLAEVLAEIHRVLKPSGRFAMVEPWPTPFLGFVHWVCGFAAARKAWPKLDALACMTEHELDTYQQWLGQPEAILERLHRRFVPEIQRTRFGKLMFLGGKRVAAADVRR